MKIITLVPAKNESWILNFSLKNFSIFSDTIIVLDDGSTDNTKEISENFNNVKVIQFDASQEKFLNMSNRRNALLAEGRKLGGTHFIFLDADEIISSPLSNNLYEYVKNMQLGETIYMPWVLTFFDENRNIICDISMRDNYKDFIFCDNGESMFEDKSLSEDRTPNNQKHITKITFETGCVYHLQELALERNKLKQIRYRCNELIEGKRSARRINATYDFTKTQKAKKPIQLIDEFVLGNAGEIKVKDETYFSILLKTLKTKELSFFEPLDIWDEPRLKDMFVTKYNRIPKMQTFPRIIITLNNIKNKFRNAIIRKI